MTITLDQNLGNANNNAPVSGNLVITTTAAAAAGSRIVVCVSYFDSSGSTVTCNDGTAYTQDKKFDNGGDHYVIFSRVLVGSLASGSSITVHWGTITTLGGVLCAACSYLGTTAIDTSSTASGTTSTSFSSGAATNTVADALFVGGAGSEAAATTVGGTDTNGTSRADIYNGTAGQGMRMLDLISTSIGSRALTGTWGSTPTSSTGALMIYKGTAAAAAPAPAPQRAPLGI